MLSLHDHSLREAMFKYASFQNQQKSVVVIYSGPLFRRIISLS